MLSRMNELIKALGSKERRFRKLYALGFYGELSDEEFIKRLFKIRMNHELNLDNPKTFNEKLQWLKLNDRKPEYTMMADKYAVKDYVSKTIGEQYVIPTLGVWKHFDDIDFSKLPNQFVLKCTHDSGGVVVCKDKSKLDLGKAKEKLERSLARNYYMNEREWQYKDIPPQIIAEEYMGSIAETPVEYKMYCFNGEVKVILVCMGEGHSKERTNDYFDRDFNRLPLQHANPNFKGELQVSDKIDEIIKIAEKLSEGIPHVRVDTYLVDDKIYFGELTFRDNSGTAKFEPKEWDYRFGEWITLSM